MRLMMIDISPFAVILNKPQYSLTIFPDRIKVDRIISDRFFSDPARFGPENF